MAKLRSINTQLWKDDFVADLEPDANLFFVYLITNPSVTIAGCYQISVREIAFDTGLERDKIRHILAKFEDQGRVLYRDNWIVLPRFLRHQHLNANMLKAASKELKAAPKWVAETIRSHSKSFGTIPEWFCNGSEPFEEEKRREEKDKKATPADAGTLDSIFDEFRVMLQNAGTNEKSARSKIGGLVKTHGKPKVTAAFNANKDAIAASIEPYAYFCKILKSFVYEDDLTKKIKNAKRYHHEIYGGLEYDVPFK